MHGTVASVCGKAIQPGVRGNDGSSPIRKSSASSATSSPSGLLYHSNFFTPYPTLRSSVFVTAPLRI